MLNPGQNGHCGLGTADSATTGVNNNYAMALTEALANSLHRDAAQTGLSTRTLPCNGRETFPGRAITARALLWSTRLKKFTENAILF